jgi:hypothetical protein
VLETLKPKIAFYEKIAVLNYSGTVDFDPEKILSRI